MRAGSKTPTPAPTVDGDLSIKRASRRAEEDLIRRALARTNGNRTRAAELLEISHRALLYKIKEYGIAGARTEADTPPPISSTRRPGGTM
jgi:two-component system response regulator AtoC